MPEALPSPLIDAVREGRAILFLGAGASNGAIHPEGKKIPNGDQLRDLICDKFLGGDMKQSPLLECSDYAIDSTDLNTFQQYIRDTFISFKPAEFHKLIPTFNWNSIFSTNYDLILEQAYRDPKPNFSPVVYIKDGQHVDMELRQHSNSFLFTKLHGSIDHYLDTEIPLVLSSDQYVSASKNRKMLFGRLLTLGSQFPVIFVGYRATDLHIKTIFNELGGLGERRPHYYYVSPNIGPYQRSYLEARRTTCIAATFEEVLSTLDKTLAPQLRSIKIEVNEALAPIKKFINIPDPKPSGDLVSFLTSDVDCIYSTMPTTGGKPSDFYEGIPLGFFPIVTELDVRRAKKTDTFLSDVFFREESGENNVVELCAVKGAAGSGKSVFLRRLAWEASSNFDCLCLFHRRTGSLRFSSIHELSAMTSARIFLFVDRAAYLVEELENLLAKARSSKIRLTVIVAERHNEWNVRCDKLEKFVTYEDEISRLSSAEISELILKLRKANALGQLEGKTDDECKEIFEQKLDRQILVALHEATKGKTFEQIVVDEYKRIIPIEAQLLYLDICTFQRLGAELRAGLISRIGGVSFDEFEERLLKPLERVVFVSKDNYGKDHLYRARHQKIAEIVFDQVLTSQKEKYDALVRLLKGMNRDFTSDNEAFQTLMHGSTLRAIFPTADLARQLLDEGLALTGNDDYVLHQRAAFELAHSDGDANVALNFINRALVGHPKDKAKLHTKANAFRRLAQQATNLVQKTHYRNEAINALNSIGAKNTRDFTLSLSIQIDELQELLKAPTQGDLTERAIASKIQDVENALTRAHSSSAADPFVLQAEARYRDAINQDKRAFDAIKKAHTVNPSIIPITLRLARLYAERAATQDAVDILTEALLKNSSKELRFELGKLLSEHPDIHTAYKKVELFERSFEKDDEQLLPRLYLLREYWREKQLEPYRALQKSLKRIPAPRHLRSQPNIVIRSNGEDEVHTGEIKTKEADYAFIACDAGYPDVFLHRSNVTHGSFDALKYGEALKFSVGFSTGGATAII